MLWAGASDVKEEWYARFAGVSELGDSDGAGTVVVVVVVHGLLRLCRLVCDFFKPVRLWMALCLDRFELSAKPLPHSSHV